MKRSLYYLLPWMLLTVAHAGNLTTVNDGLSCAPEKDEFIWFNVGCFLDRKVAPLDPTARRQFATEKEYLEEDMRVCDCLRKNPLSKPLVDSPLNEIKLVADKEANIYLRNAKGNIDDFKARLQVKKDILLYQGWFFSPDKARDEKVYRSYNLMRSSEISPDVKAALKQKIQTEGESHLGRKLIAYENEVIDKVILSNQKESKIKEVMSGNPVPGESCMPMHTFLTVHQMPFEREFWEDISQMNSFRPEDWDYDALKKEMNSKLKILNGYPGSDVVTLKTRVRALRARLLFLNKNPMFKNGLKSKAQIGQQSLQESVFKMIKTYMSPKDSSCLDRDGDCQLAFIRSGDVDALKEAGAKFFKEDKVIAAMKEQVDLDMKEEIERITAKKELSNLEVNLTQDLLAQKVQETTNFDITSCTDTGADLIKCTESFSLYCRILDESKDRIANAIPDFEKEWLNEITPDPKKNRLYQEKSKKFCEGTFRTGEFPDEEMDFPHFQKDYCEDSKNAEVCGDRDKLFKAFLKKYPIHVNLEEEKRVEDILSGKGNPTVIAATFKSMPRPTTESAAFQEAKPDIADPKVADQLQEDTDKVVAESGGGFFSALKNLFSSDEESVVSESTPNSSSSEAFSEGSTEIIDGAASEEPGMFSSIMKDLATTMNEGAPVETGYESDYSNYSYSAGLADSNSAPVVEEKAALAETQKLKEENDEEKEEMEEELEEVRKKLATATEEASRSGLENRVKLLEELLAQKDKMAENYEKLIEKLTKEQEEKIAAHAEAPQVKTTEAGPAQTQTKTNSSQVTAESSKEETGSRAPASVAEQNFSTAGARSGGASNSLSSPQRSVSSVKVNEALLSKYGVTVQGSTEGSVLVATDRDSQSLPALTTSPETKNVPLDVSRTQFDKFRSNDLETLKEIYDSRIKSIEGSIIKISVRTKGEKEALEFYAIKEGDKVVFQPVRKARLGDLKLTLPKQGL